MRSLLIGLISCLFMTFWQPSAWAAEIEPNLGKQARSAILIDASTGAILFEKNSHESLPPASITKIMTLLLVMEELDEGNIDLNDHVRVSEKAASMGGSQIYLEPGERMSVHDLLKGVAVGSANDATVALAEFIAGSEEQFVIEMNKKAKQLGLKESHFVNTNGLPEKDHYSSAHDIAMISRELLKHPQITKYTSIYEDHLRKDSKKPFWLVNTNKLLRHYPGLDGLKTGFTQEAKFCLSATAKRGNLRVIGVVMGEPDSKARNQEMTQLMDHAFQRYTNHLVFRKGDRIQTIEIKKGNPDKVNLYANQDIAFLMKKGESPKQLQHRFVWDRMQAPIQKGAVVGYLQLEKDGNVVAEIPLSIDQSIQEATLWESVKKSLGQSLWIR